MSGIIFVIRNGLRWRDAPTGYGPHKTIYNRFIRWSRLGDRGYDADWFRDAFADRKIAACIPSRVNRRVPIPHDTVLYRQRHEIEIMFGRLKDWLRIHTRHDRCAHTFFSAICITATVIFWL